MTRWAVSEGDDEHLVAECVDEERAQRVALGLDALRSMATEAEHCTDGRLIWIAKHVGLAPAEGGGESIVAYRDRLLELLRAGQ